MSLSAFAAKLAFRTAVPSLLLTSYVILPPYFLKTPSDFRPPTSTFGLPPSDFRLPTSDFRLQTSNFRLPPAPASCFLLYEIGKGEQRRNPSTTCTTRVSPQSTFKIPHALAALDAGVITEQETMAYDGHPVDFDAWRRPHTLATAMRYSVVWFFQEIARRLGMERERRYLDRFQYGNRDPSSGLTTFWLGGSLAISPEEQLQFLLKLYGDSFPASQAAVETVRRILVQPRDKVVNALGERPFAAPWPDAAVVSAKTGSGRTAAGGQVRWLAGHVRRGSRAWIFVANVVGGGETPAGAAVELAERALIEERVLR